MSNKNKVLKLLRRNKLKEKKKEYSIKNQITNQIFASPVMIFNILMIIIIALVCLRNLYINASSDIKKYIENTNTDMKEISIFKNINEIDIFISSNSYNSGISKVIISRFVVFPQASVVNIKSEKNRFINHNNLIIKTLIVIN